MKTSWNFRKTEKFPVLFPCLQGIQPKPRNQADFGWPQTPFRRRRCNGG